MSLDQYDLEFKKAYSAANSILVSSKVIETFPFAPRKLISEKTSIKCRSYKKAAEYGLDITAFGTESAIIMEYHSKTIIFYDETKPKAHSQFSLLHEFGHNQLGHDFTDKRPEIYRKYEIEANCFAAQLLMPEQILRELQKRGVAITNTFLQQVFGASYEAANKRINTLAHNQAEWHSRSEREFDDLILLKYSSFIDSIKPKHSYYDFDYEDEIQSRRDSWY